LLAAVLLAPASSTFVSLSQATLMDLDPPRHEQQMARWTFAGSAGAVVGPLALGAVVALRLGWRELFAGLVGLTLLTLAMTWGCRVPVAQQAVGRPTFRAGVSNALRALRRREVLRWLSLLECSDLMLDILLGHARAEWYSARAGQRVWPRQGADSACAGAGGPALPPERCPVAPAAGSHRTASGRPHDRCAATEEPPGAVSAAACLPEATSDH